MSLIATRRLRLLADRRAPSAVRTAIRDVLDETDLTELADDVMLLASELVTNAVLHAGTGLEVAIEVGASHVRVAVTDGDRSSLPAVGQDAATRPPLASHGRGLALVDRMATRWGVVHDKSGKSVWFEVGRADVAADPIPPASPPVAAAAEAAAPQPAEASPPEPTGASALVEPRVVPRDPETKGEVERVAADLAAQLVAAHGVSAVTITVDPGDGHGPRLLAAVGSPERLHTPLSMGVPLTPPTSGTITVHTASVRDDLRRLTRLGAQALSVAADNDRLRAADLRRRAEVAFITGASDLLAQSLQVELTTALVPRLFVPRLGQWCAVLLCVDGGRPELVAATHAEEARIAAVTEALEQPANRLVLRDATTPGQPATLGAGADGVAVPLTVADRRLGVLAVGRPPHRRHDPDELAVIVDLARRTALALDNAQLHEERRAVTDTLQQALLPAALPDVTGVRFAAEYIPAIGGVDVGGDFYDVLAMPDSRWFMMIGDVSGKGAAAATVTGLVRNVIRVLVREGRSAPEILGRINETLAERAGGRYATLAVAVVDPAGPRVHAEVFLAGHERPILVRQSGQTQAVGTCGSALGLLGSISVVAEPVVMEPGDTLVFFTDGVTERRRGPEMFGLDRTHDVLGPLAGHDADIVAARLRSAVLGFSPETPRDDIAILALRNDARPIPAQRPVAAGHGAAQRL